MSVKMKRTFSDVLLHTYTLLIGLVSVALFLYGFFPVKYDDNGIASTSDIPDRIGPVRVKTDELYRPVAKKIVVMVVDALRWDFVIGPVGTSSMPITSSLINGKSSCLMQAKSNPPTVTMPRIKAMMTGAVSSFIDVALNFGDLPISGDSLLLQAKKQGHKIHFYGDDTWLKIFPGMFDRYEGTNSFYVNDFTEVDDNVTRHLAKELERKDDWSLLFLHYLGLDHIGHVAGPFSPLVRPKLLEMDKIIGQIHSEIQNWNENGLPAFFVICGDHGMKNSGGHGGSTDEETLVPFLVIGASCPSKPNEPNRISQVDVASILSMLLGAPIPSSNIGSVPLHMLNDRSDSSKLFVLHYNAQRIMRHFEKISNSESSDAYRYYEDAIQQHVVWLTDKEAKSAIDGTLNLYDKAFRRMKELLIHSTIDYDLHTMTIAMIFMAHIVFIMASERNNESGGIMKSIYWLIGSVISYFLLRFLWESESVILPVNLKNLSFNITAIGIFALNGHLITNMTTTSFRRVWKCEIPEYLLILGMIAHTVSLTSSSFVEEEHQTWFFFWTTLLILWVFDVARKNFNPKLTAKMMLCLVAHRVLRKLNSTGNKYAHSPDIAGWLRDRENCAAMTSLLIAALGLLIFIGWKCEKKLYRYINSIMHVGAAICIYLRHMAGESVAKLPSYFASRGIVEVQVFWAILISYSLLWAYRLARTKDRELFASSLLRFIVQIWTMTSAILHRPHNVVLLPMQIFASYVIHDALPSCDTAVDIYVYMWLGNVFYFYQGNSNSLATIDVAAGYVGMESYRPLITGIFLSINTYSAPVLAYLCLLYRRILLETPNSYPERTLELNKKYALWRFLPLAAYTIIVTIQRFHLFVWTVFSPKLLYEAMYCTVTFAIILTMQIVIHFATRN